MHHEYDASDTCEALTVREVAERLHVSRPTVEKWIKDGQLPSLEIGGCRRVLRRDLETFISFRRSHGWRALRTSRRQISEGQQPKAQESMSDPNDDIPF